MKPTISRCVWYRTNSVTDFTDGMQIYDLAQPCAAQIVFVHSDNCVNLVVFDHAGTVWLRQMVPINEVPIGARHWAEWPVIMTTVAKKDDQKRDMALETVGRLAMAERDDAMKRDMAERDIALDFTNRDMTVGRFKPR